jgi:hypothetical protein
MQLALDQEIRPDRDSVIVAGPHVVYRPPWDDDGVSRHQFQVHHTLDAHRVREEVHPKAYLIGLSGLY